MAGCDEQRREFSIRSCRRVFAVEKEVIKWENQSGGEASQSVGCYTWRLHWGVPECVQETSWTSTCLQQLSQEHCDVCDQVRTKRQRWTKVYRNSRK